MRRIDRIRNLSIDEAVDIMDKYGIVPRGLCDEAELLTDEFEDVIGCKPESCRECLRKWLESEIE